MNLTCEGCGKKLELGRDGLCNCGKELCYECYLKNGHRAHVAELQSEEKIRVFLDKKVAYQNKMLEQDKQVSRKETA